MQNHRRLEAPNKHKTLATFFAGAFLLVALNEAKGQYTPPPPSPFQGFINEYMNSLNGCTNHWNIGGVDRERYVAYEGYGIAGKPGSVDFRDHGASVDNQYLLSRIRLLVAYADDWWSAYVEGQSSLADGDHRAAYANAPAVIDTTKTIGYGPESDAIDLHQGYFTLGNTNEFPLDLKVGRQELVYGEERLIGAFDWNNIGRSFDAAKVRWQNEWGGVDFFTGMPVVPVDGRFDMPNTQDWLSGAYATFTRIPTTILEGYFLARNVSRSAVNFYSDSQFPQPTARDVYTVGGRLKSEPGELDNFDFTLEGAYQFGDFAVTATSPRLTQNAFMAIAEGGYTFANWWATPRLGAEFDYSSGDDNPNDGTHGTFDTLFPTPHKFFGSMDLFSLQNIQDLGVNFTLKPTRRTSVALMGNAFWLADTDDYLYSATGAPRTTGGYGIHPNYSPFVGTELSLVAGYAITSFAQVEAGYGHFFSGDYIAESQAANGGARDADWIYIQTSLKF
ncbi:MAG TPA: alginate export family protein [Candidatus Acidoferrales bacterium]|nr:alginate export family protein [Candidatus Acidoferrales bacterium]